MEKKKIYIVIGIAILFAFLFFREYSRQLDIKTNSIATTGKIIEFRSNYQARYTLVYEYYVEEKRYTGAIGITPFNCDDGKNACIGHEFTVYYSSKNPKNSRIDLGKYEKYKTTVEFIK